MRATSHQLEITQFRFQSQIVGSRVCPMKSVNTVSKLVCPIFTVQSIVGYILSSLSTSSQLLSLFKTLHWWSRVISASQFRHLEFSDDTLEGVKANGAGEGNFWTYGETRRGDRLIIGGVSGERWLLSNSFSGDSISSSPIWKSLGQRGKVWGRKDSWRRVSFWQLVYSLQAWTILGQSEGEGTLLQLEQLVKGNHCTNS